jgi:hypothetical protein
MAREQLQARCDADTVGQIEQYAEEKDIAKSEAMRRMLRAGLRVKGYRDETGENVHIGEGAVRDLSDTPELSEANISGTVRLLGGALVGLAIIVYLLSELGLI